MDRKIEQRICIKFCYRIGKLASETLDLLKLAFGNENVNKSTTFRWFSRFKNGMESVKDEKRVGYQGMYEASPLEPQLVYALVHRGHSLSLQLAGLPLHGQEDAGPSAAAVHTASQSQTSLSQIASPSADRFESP
ncbi:hypothetical protein LAZ67_3001198 [Cordylochernes scorpioides]|uniref:Mos1 transposase HTH domain-containing protein n=1 Tax=Cordylochernes scorpioides TaxID=51811 RepID=A0ABY6K7K9_9ARAC|nr:hypothetical protein LAZ67_3001198 [Cordylochernes scorpioides]